MSYKDFKVAKFLGKGTYGAVYKVIRVSDGKIYALKEVDMKNKQQSEREDAVNEIRILASVKHQNIIRYRDSFFEQDKLFIVTEFADSGDLNDEIARRRAANKKFTEDEIWAIFLQVAEGMNYLHERRILHRDLKCSNIFLTQGKFVKIGDLGVAKLLKMSSTQTQVGTPYYISPEIWRKMPYNDKSDVWALGCVMYEMATFRHPFNATSPKELANKILRGRYLPLPACYSPTLSGLIDKMLSVDAKIRPNLRTIFEMKAVIDRMHLLPVVQTPRSSTGDVRIVDTIKVPRNLTRISLKLPTAAYVSPVPERPERRVSTSPARMHAPAPASAAVPAQAPPPRQPSFAQPAAAAARPTVGVKPAAPVVLQRPATSSAAPALHLAGAVLHRIGARPMAALHPGVAARPSAGAAVSRASARPVSAVAALPSYARGPTQLHPSTKPVVISTNADRKAARDAILMQYKSANAPAAPLRDISNRPTGLPVRKPSPVRINHARVAAGIDVRRATPPRVRPSAAPAGARPTTSNSAYGAHVYAARPAARIAPSYIRRPF